MHIFVNNFLMCDLLPYLVNINFILQINKYSRLIHNIMYMMFNICKNYYENNLGKYIVYYILYHRISKTIKLSYLLN
ncbi:hypothetical protein [Sulfolobus islandicus rod-shaped virus 2]|uniref:Uncharacterized protein n=1 Tax=Sulfolobus islandicus rod-shaped virus 2 TaxID=157899 RepID=Q8V9P3_SIRV2|nr:hypothetical protein SIRV2gp25 [Sulfolobus islandicus rod-shaped virus 2]CAC87300.1 hypothetical protein [Sulfolobus islandicus rod-shaped virus 2]